MKGVSSQSWATSVTVLKRVKFQTLAHSPLIVFLAACQSERSMLELKMAATHLQKRNPVNVREVM
jgi:hypothetical protein